MDEKKEQDLEQILDELSESSAEKTAEKPKFELHLDLDSEYGEPIPMPPKPVEEEPKILDADEEAVHTDEEEEKPKKEQSTAMGCLKVLLYGIVVLLAAGFLAYVVIVGGMDISGITRDDTTVDVTVPAGANTEAIANLLAENGLIEQPMIFRVYAKFTKADGKWQPGEFSLRGDMGYDVMITELQKMQERKTVRVTIPEGFTIKQIAERLENKGVCTTAEFFRALSEDEKFLTYDFIMALSEVDEDKRNARYYPFEGYLFPDTYEFFVGCSGETAVKKLLDGFDYRLDTTLRSAMQAKNLTVDELIILASIVQGEAASKDDMKKVARVLWNRLENTAEYPKLECDSTRDYVTDMMAGNTAITISDEAFDTYVCEGLPAGAINNPGLDAIKAVLYPSEEESVMKCYFFATDYDTGITYFSETYARHVSICKKYGIGMYG
ncbi:MAG: endolytic transglycosylase MltG [Clostridia bacterium]|nr:endolytic transglycosylase MltG [Clostridia bacterium]